MVPIYLIYEETPGTQWKVINEQNRVLFSGINTDCKVLLSFCRGLQAGINTQTSLRRQLYTINMDTFDKESAPRHLTNMYKAYSKHMLQA